MILRYLWKRTLIVDNLYIFLAQFFSVFALVMSSKLLRDDRWILAMANSWLISLTSFIYVYLASKTGEPVVLFFWSALGGSLGCGVSHHFYTKLIRKNKCTIE